MPQPSLLVNLQSCDIIQMPVFCSHGPLIEQRGALTSREPHKCWGRDADSAVGDKMVTGRHLGPSLSQEPSDSGP